MRGFERGILYIATGPSFVAEAVGSAESVRAVWPDMPLALITDTPPPGGCFDHVEIVAAERNSRDKPCLMGRSPFERRFSRCRHLLLRAISRVVRPARLLRAARRPM